MKRSRYPTVGRASFEKPRLVPVTRRIPWREQYTHLNWLRMKKAILERDRHQCRWCFTKKRKLHVHHRFYAKRGYIWDVPYHALITLCGSCHREIHAQIKAKKDS